MLRGHAYRHKASGIADVEMPKAPVSMLSCILIQLFITVTRYRKLFAMCAHYIRPMAS